MGSKVNTHCHNPESTGRHETKVRTLADPYGLVAIRGDIGRKKRAAGGVSQAVYKQL